MSQQHVALTNELDALSEDAFPDGCSRFPEARAPTVHSCFWNATTEPVAADASLSSHRASNPCQAPTTSRSTSSLGATDESGPCHHDDGRRRPNAGSGSGDHDGQTALHDDAPVLDCEASAYVRAIAKQLKRSDDEIAPILKHLIQQHWIERIAHLEALSDADWRNLPYPRQFVRSMREQLPHAYELIGKPPRQRSATEGLSYEEPSCTATATTATPTYPLQKTAVSVHRSAKVGHETTVDHSAMAGGQLPIGSFDGVSSSSTTQPEHNNNNDVAHFVRSVCRHHGISPTIEEETVRCLVEENWYDTLESLRSLTLQQWNMLAVPAEVADVLLSTLQATDPMSLRSLVSAAGKAMKRSASQMDDTIHKLEEAGYTTGEDLRHVSDEEWVGSLRLPLRLLDAVRRELALRDDTVFGVTPGLSMEHALGSQDDMTMSRAATAVLGGEKQSSAFGAVASRRQITDAFDAKDPRIVSTQEERDARKMTVAKFLKKVGATVGKPDAELDPLIERVIRDHWVDSLDALRSLSSDDWQDLGLPKRLIDHIRNRLNDPVMLELNTVQLVPAEPDLFPCDIHTAVWKLETEIPPEKLPDTLRSLIRLVETILCNPFDETKRVIRKTNANFQARAACYKSALLFLRALGYEEAGDRYVLPIAYVSRITEAHAALAQLAQVYRDRLRKSKKSHKSDLFSAIRYKRDA